MRNTEEKSHCLSPGSLKGKQRKLSWDILESVAMIASKKKQLFS